MKTRTASEIAAITGGQLFLKGNITENEPIDHIITDSRNRYSAPKGMFAAINTHIADGHSYIQSMLNKGVKVFLVEQVPDVEGDAVFIKVPSVRKALQDLALAALATNSAKRIIITGSYGKTPVKELLYSSLLENAKVARSPRSWNSSLGLPLSILDMEGDGAEYEILEVAIDGPGQAKALEPLLKGDIGILTAIGPQHDEAFPSHEAKIREKLELLKNCRTIIYPSNLSEVRELFPPEKYHLIPVESDPRAIVRALKGEGLPIGGFEWLPLVSSRFTISEAAEGNIIIRDNFTADLRELKESLEFAARRFTETHTPILLTANLKHGPLSEEALKHLYSEAEKLARDFGIKRIIGVGYEWQMYGQNVENATNLTANRPVNSLILATGVAETEVEKLLSSIESASHDTTLDVDLEAMIHNYNYYRSLLPAGTGIVAMVKASAYGMGATEIAKTLQSHGAACLAVAVIDEGVSLRQAGISMPIMVLNPVTNRYPLLFACNLEPAVFSIEELERLIREAEEFGVKDYPIHLKLDTGMHRLGFIPLLFNRLCVILRNTDTVKVKSIFTHLATADCPDKNGYTYDQIAKFNEWSKELEEKLGYPVLRHYLNTAGMMRFADSGHYDMTRLGIGLYGIAPYEGSDAPLEPVATFRTRIISLKEWEAGTYIGYGNNGCTTRPSIIATVPVGYADGVDRHLGRGRASFVVKGHECPTIGNICMDLCMIDVTDVPGVAVGDDVEIFGKQMPIERVAQILDTIPYEVLTSVSPRVKRQYSRK